MERARADLAKMMSLLEPLTEEEWTGFWPRTRSWARCPRFSTPAAS